MVTLAGILRVDIPDILARKRRLFEVTLFGLKHLARGEVLDPDHILEDVIQEYQEFGAWEQAMETDEETPTPMGEQKGA